MVTAKLNFPLANEEIPALQVAILRNNFTSGHFSEFFLSTVSPSGNHAINFTLAPRAYCNNMRWKRSGSDLVYVSDVVGIRHVQNQNREPVLNPPPREVGIERPLTWEPGHRLLSHVTVTTRSRLHQETPMPILKCILTDASSPLINK
ncbi:hypothetical protein K0M31_000498 [Melipona bicolor]|uniref:Uncharacterized protein n=1 Tax=Melipona bicolor TaxID=60889 RepID=A0AA40GDM3_9HYME|nr:hypothetical protein K0M31_000498 [Melipona bicolor]